jgi:hypothetical protein
MALSGVRFASVGPRPAPLDAPHPSEARAKGGLMKPTPSRLARQTLSNLAVLAGAWLLALGLVQVATRTIPGWFAAPIAILLAAAAGVYAALRLRATFALLLILGTAASVASTLAAHATWGIRSVQGGPIHLTIIAAAMLGVTFGALGSTARRRLGARPASPSPAEP